jgi:hypothetical protein
MTTAVRLQTWTQTRLWETLAAGPDHPIKPMLQSSMDAIETVLRQGGTAPASYTLHDIAAPC